MTGRLQQRLMQRKRLSATPARPSEKRGTAMQHSQTVSVVTVSAYANRHEARHHRWQPGNPAGCRCPIHAGRLRLLRPQQRLRTAGDGAGDAPVCRRILPQPVFLGHPAGHDGRALRFWYSEAEAAGPADPARHNQWRQHVGLVLRRAAAPADGLNRIRVYSAAMGDGAGGAVAGGGGALAALGCDADRLWRRRCDPATGLWRGALGDQSGAVLLGDVGVDGDRYPPPDFYRAAGDHPGVSGADDGGHCWRTLDLRLDDAQRRGMDLAAIPRHFRRGGALLPRAGLYDAGGGGVATAGLRPAADYRSRCLGHLRRSAGHGGVGRRLHRVCRRHLYQPSGGAVGAAAAAAMPVADASGASGAPAKATAAKQATSQ